MSGTTRRLGGCFRRWLPILYMGCKYVGIAGKKGYVWMSRDGVNWGLWQFCWGYGLCEFAGFISFFVGFGVVPPCCIY